MSRYPIHVLAMAGLGDTVYQRPFLRALAEKHGTIYVQTPWPELVSDIPGVLPTYPHGIGLRTQEKNAEGQEDGVFHRPPLQPQKVRPRYTLRKEGDTIVRELGETFGLHPRTKLVWDLPDMGTSPVRYRTTPVAVVRPVTLRREWMTPARAPDPAYVYQACEILRDMGYAVVLVADTNERDERIEGDVPPADKLFVRGELSTQQMLALIQHADVVVGGVGFIVPVGIATGVPTVVVGGGLGGHNAPDVITDPARMDTSHMRFILPEPYCRCRSRRHACNKRIPNFGDRFCGALGAVTVAEGVAA